VRYKPSERSGRTVGLIGPQAGHLRYAEQKSQERLLIFLL
jgi:hypothetical protein